jgi:hypothetical protein
VGTQTPPMSVVPGGQLPPPPPPAEPPEMLASALAVRCVLPAEPWMVK